jgi:hypothetical protein
MSSGLSYPLMYSVGQALVSRPIKDVPGTVRAQLATWDSWGLLPPGASIAITAGSRGVQNIVLILRTICEALYERGFSPFVVPAMGSHGGGTVEGQLAVLSSLGITPEAVGAPIRGSAELDEVGRSGAGHPVVIDRLANRADGLIVVGRIKKHTDYTSATESGLMKMIAIGLGKHQQAAHIHSFGTEGLRTFIPEFASIVLEKCPVLFGLAILEDGYHQTSDIVLIRRELIASQEPVLLQQAVGQMARLPVKEIDVLIVEWMGKDFSGTGMDTNVIGRYGVEGEPDPPEPDVRYLVVLDLTEASHGNAIGVGLADLTTERLFRKIDQQAFYLNASTSGFLSRGKIPLICQTDRKAIDLALRLLGPVARDQARVVRIKSTYDLSSFWVSASLTDELHGRPGVTIAPNGKPLQFSAEGLLE